MNPTVVFLGPSLSEGEAKKELPATYLPPVAQGDVLRALRAGARRIGIIDGFFNHVRSVWHKEILVAIEEGAVVYGASSMGALRAAELHTFGMIGVGKIFEWYRDGVLNDDDEVAVVHGPSETGFLAQSVALVNVRDDARAAVDARILDAATAECLVELARSQFYPERSYASLERLALERGVERHVVDAFIAFATAREPLKRRDARALLRRMAEDRDAPAPERTRVERTFFLERLRSKIELERAMSAAPALAPGALTDLRKHALLRVLAIEHARDTGMLATLAETQAMADDFRLARQLTTEEGMLAWLSAADLTLERFSEIAYELATVRKLEHFYGQELERRLADQVKLGLVQGAPA